MGVGVWTSASMAYRGRAGVHAGDETHLVCGEGCLITHPTCAHDGGEWPVCPRPDAPGARSPVAGDLLLGCAACCFAMRHPTAHHGDANAHKAAMTSSQADVTATRMPQSRQPRTRRRSCVEGCALTRWGAAMWGVVRMGARFPSAPCRRRMGKSTGVRLPALSLSPK